VLSVDWLAAASLRTLAPPGLVFFFSVARSREPVSREAGTSG
jgi:hypothetical protein